MLLALRTQQQHQPSTASAVQHVHWQSSSASTAAKESAVAGKMTSAPALSAAPRRAKRSRQAADNAQGASASAPLSGVPGLQLSSRHVPVVVQRHESGSIGKAARGAAAFLVYLKLQQTWLLVSCPSEVCGCSIAAHHTCL